MQARLLVDRGEDGCLLRLGRVEGTGEVELEALGDEVLEFDLGSEEVGRGPCLGGSVTIKPQWGRKCSDRAEGGTERRVEGNNMTWVQDMMDMKRDRGR